jgi:hypothetical protein
MEILRILIAGGILGAILNLLFHHLSLQRQYRQALDQKVIDRISDLVEDYYAQISCASEALRNALEFALPAIRKTQQDELSRQICFYHLLTYLHNIERLTQKRPKPLFTEIRAERDYVKQISEIYDGIPLGYYDISFLLNRCRVSAGLIPVHEFIRLIVDNEEKFKNYYDVFSVWLDECNCGEHKDDTCKVHQVMQACSYICEILDDQIQKMYRLWYDRPKRRPREKK